MFISLHENILFYGETACRMTGYQGLESRAYGCQGQPSMESEQGGPHSLDWGFTLVLQPVREGSKF